MTRVLLVDTARETAQHIERRLRLWGFECALAESFLYALTMLEWQRPELIVIRNEVIDDMTADAFASTVNLDPVLRAIPMILAVGSAGTRVALEHFDLVVEDPDVRMLGSHLARFVRQPGEGERAPALGYRPPAIAAGKVSWFEFGDLIEQLSLGLHSGRLTMQSASQRGQIFVVFDHGQIVHSVFGGLEGPPAFHRLLEELKEEGSLEGCFDAEPRWQISSYPRSIQQADRSRLMAQASHSGRFGSPAGRLRLQPN